MGPKIHTHYDNLKVARNAPDFVIRAAYRALSQQYHPDKHGGSPSAANAMRLINEAYAELSDPARRAAHDAWIGQQEARDRAKAQADHQAKAREAPSSPPPPKKPATAPNPSPPPRATTPSGQSNLWAYGGGLLILILVVALMNSEGTRTSAPTSSAGYERTSNLNQGSSPHGANLPQASPPPRNAAAIPVTTRPLNVTPAPIPVTSLLPRGRVNAPELNVRAGPGANHDVVARLRFLDTVSIEGPVSNGWMPVSHQAGFGYVNGIYIQSGPDVDTLRTLCQEEGPGPKSGTILKRSSTVGDHELRINATIDHDALVKLKDPQGRTVLSGFVRRGEMYTFQGIPSGVYTTWFATGRAFSSRCGRFLQDMSVTYDPKPHQYRATQNGNLMYSTVMEYSLQRQLNGNFSPTAGDSSAFLAD